MIKRKINARFFVRLSVAICAISIITSSGWLYLVIAAKLKTYWKLPPSSSKTLLIVAKKIGVSACE